jgi:hypothetical protein
MKRSFKWGPGATQLFLEADKTSGGEGGEVPTTTTQAPPKEVKDLPEWAQKLVTDLRAESADNRVARTKLEKAAQAAEEARLTDDKKFEELATKHQARVKELEPKLEAVEARLKTYEEMFTRQLETETKDWPEEVKALDPGKDATFEMRMSWLEKSRPLVVKLAASTTQTTTSKGTGRLPKSGQASDGKNDKYDFKLHSV